MPRQEVNIGVEGNDGTGDSIRASFNKVNENFIELYAVFGIGGQIKFTSLSDTPDTLTANTIPLVNSAGTAVNLVQLASNSAVDANAQDSVNFSYDTAGKLVITSGFGQVADDLSPTLGGPLDAGNRGIANVAISDAAASNMNAQHSALSNITIDDLVITKGYADQRYVTSAVPVRVDDQASGTGHYTWNIETYVSNQINIIKHTTAAQVDVATGHGLNAAYNGTLMVFNAAISDAGVTGLTSGEKYYIRILTNTNLKLFKYDSTKAKTEDPGYLAATQVSDTAALAYTDSNGNPVAIDVVGSKPSDSGDVHTLTLASFDSTLSGTYLADQALPRKEVVMRSGDTMTGSLFLNDHPGDFAGIARSPNTEDYRAATKFYVDNSGYSSPEVLYVSTKGDDLMRNAPSGKEGTSKSYAFKTINAAAQRAEDLIRTAPIRPGPYTQTLTHTAGGTTSAAQIMRGAFKDGVFFNARRLLERNKEYIQKETTAYINKTYPNYTYDEARCQKDLGLIIDSIAFDLNKGVSSNSLTRIAGERYYSSVSGRRAITAQITYTEAAFNFAKTLSTDILRNQLNDAITITGISTAAIGVVTTQANSHPYSDGDIIVFKDIPGMTQIEGKTAYIKTLAASPNQFQLYENSALTVGFNTTSFTAFTTSSTGKIGTRYQLFESQVFDVAEVVIAAVDVSKIPVVITTVGNHFLDDNENITIAGSTGITGINGSTNRYVRRLNDTQFRLYSNTFNVKNISSADTTTDVVITSFGHGLQNNSTAIVFTDVTATSGKTTLENTLYYVGDRTDDTFTVYTDAARTTKLSNSGISGITGGTITLNAVAADSSAAWTGSYTANSGKITKPSSSPDTQVNAVQSKWNLIVDIIKLGIDSGSAVNFGKPYQIVVSNGNQNDGEVDQTDADNKDALAGKVIRGKRSNALGLITKVTNNVTIEGTTNFEGNAEERPTVFEMNLLEARDFEVGEEIEFGNKNVNKQVLIEVEAGSYKEDYPIRITKNVSLKGDEFRRVVISPATEANGNVARVSQSKYAQTYFYRDSQFDGMNIITGGSADFYNQDQYDSSGQPTGTPQGKFGYHYLQDPANPINIDNAGAITVTNAGLFSVAESILKANRDYITAEMNNYLSVQETETGATFIYSGNDRQDDLKLIIDALRNDLLIGGKEKSLEIQGFLDGRSFNADTTTAVTAMLNYLSTLVVALLGGNTLTADVTIGSSTYTPGTQTTETVVILKNANNIAITSETGSTTAAQNLISLITFGINSGFKPPKRNDQLDVFMLDDTTVIRNVSCRGHGGFMGVLDPDGQILTKSPYVQNATSFSKSINAKTFAGGMYIDAYTGNLPVNIVNGEPASQKVVNSVVGFDQIRVNSATGQGLYRRAPQLPCPFYIDGIRHTVTAITEYDKGNGTALLSLDPNTNSGRGYTPSQYTDTTSGTTGNSVRAIALQTAGNRSMLANGFTQVNDLGYGTVATNGGLSEQVSQFSYYTQAAMYANNGSEIRALNCSSGYGNFGLVAEGADPNEIPDQVTLKDNMTMPIRAYTNTSAGSATYTNNINQTTVVVYQTTRVPAAQSQISINHTVAGRLNYKVSSVQDLGDDATPQQVSGFITSAQGKTLYRLTLQVDNVSATDYFGDLQEALAHDTLIEYRDDQQFIYENVRTPATLQTRPSTAINFDESDDVTYRTLDFAQTDSVGSALSSTQVKTTLEVGYDHIRCISTDWQGLKNQSGQAYIIVKPLSTSGSYPETTRLNNMLFSWAGRLHKVTSVRPLTTLEGVSSTSVNDGDTITQVVNSVTVTGTAALQHSGTTLHVYNVTGGSFQTGITIYKNGNASGSPSAVYTGNSSAVLLKIEKLSGSTDVASVTGSSGLSENLPSITLTFPNNLPTIAVNTTLTQGSGITADVAQAVVSGTTKILQLYNVQGTWTNTANIEFDTNSANDQIPATVDSTGTTLFAGLAAASTAEITVKISITRASNHDFTQIGTGSFNQSNYPSSIFGDPVKPDLAGFYTDAPSATEAQVYEKRKGRVFFVSTDQFGFFRVGKFFNVDQGTGKITFAGDLGISNADALGFKKGVVVEEFSPDDAMTDGSDSAVPTEKAVKSYIKRVLGYDPGPPAQTIPTGSRIGPGFLPLTGVTPMEGVLNMGGTGGPFKIENLAAPTSATDAANKAYVDQNSDAFARIATSRDFGNAQYTSGANAGDIIPPAANELLVSTGNKILIVNNISGTFADNEQIGNSYSGSTTAGASKRGTTVQTTTYTDQVFGGSVTKVIYTEDTTSNPFVSSDKGSTLYANGGATATILSNGPLEEFTNAKEATGSDISITITRTQPETSINFQYKSETIVNADVAANAAIAQTKLDLTVAGTAADTSGLTKADLGIAKFNSGEFTSTGTTNTGNAGFISLADNGITTTKLANIGANKVLGNATSSTGAVTAIDINALGGLLPSDFAQASDFSGANVGKQYSLTVTSLDGTNSTDFNKTEFTSAPTASTIPLRDTNGNLRANGFVLGGDATYEVITGSGTALQIKTPQGRNIFSASGSSTTEATPQFLDNLAVGADLTAPTRSTVQAAPNGLTAGNVYESDGALFSNWTYTKAIQNIDHGTNNNCGIVFGNAGAGGFSSQADDSMIIFHSATESYKIDSTSISPLVNGSKNLGTSSLTWNTVYAGTFTGTALQAKYADLAENYLADDKYEVGTVLVFGGTDELTVSTKKDDTSIAGVVSEKPAYLMNTDLQGENVTALALQGRVKCMVIGKIAKGDMLVASAVKGHAMSNNNPRLGAVIGKAVENKSDTGKGIIEIVVGRV